MQRLSHRGADGSGEWRAKDVYMGHRRLWTTPEEIGEQQPLRLAGLPFTLVFDGRLDNRQDIQRQLGEDSRASEANLSDAAIVLQAYARWREDCFAKFIGEFALVIYDEERREILCARDPLGDRTLYYAKRGAQVAAASEAWAAAANLNDSSINERAAAHYFALQVPPDGQTLFNNVFELPPAHWMKINKMGQRIQRYWQPDPQKKIRYKTDKEYADHFYALLKESVHCRMRSATPIGAMMSGGLDSTSVASLAAQEQPLTAFSYVFDEVAECDERLYINAMQAQYRLRSIQMPCDDAYPYRNWRAWTRNPNLPEGNPYRLLKERAYRRAQEEGIRVLLTGGFGDHLYDGAEEWLADLLEDGHYAQAARQMTQALKVFGLKSVLAAPSLRRTVKRAIKKRRRAPSKPAWLTPLAASYLQNEAPQEEAFASKSNLLGLLVSQSGTGDCFSASRFQVELRHPYRDRRLVEFMLALPAYQLYYHGAYKHILRNAMQGILPETIRARKQPTSLMPLYLRGVRAEQETLRQELQKKRWQTFIRKEWLETRWNVPPIKDGAAALIPWLCFSYEAWLANQ